MKNNHRILEFGGMMNKAPLMMKSYYESRGNSWYSLIAMYDTAKANTSVDNFFKSFTVLNFPSHEWNFYSPADKAFTTWSPSNFEFNKESSAIDSDLNYTAFDTSRADTYIILKQSFSKYYWQKNDSDLWEKLIPQSSDYTDSLLSKKAVTNGNIAGYEITLQEGGSVNVKRKRMILNEGKLFELLTIQPASEIYNDNNNKFFDEFRFRNTGSNASLFVSKATLLLNDLSLNDSAVRSDAKNYLAKAPFSKDEIPLLYDALLKKYPSDETDDYLNIKSSIQRKIIDLDDSASVPIAKDDYFKTDNETKNLLLGIIVSFPTSKNFNCIRALLLQQPPEEKLSRRFISSFTDSMELAASTFPSLLPLMKDSFMAPGIICIGANLLDSNMIRASSLLPYKDDILQFSRKEYRIAKNEYDDYDYTIDALVRILGRINSPECNESLQNWSMIKNPELQLQCVSALLRNKQIVKPEVIQKLAENKSTRIDLFDSLNAYKKANLFPNEFLTQKSFAESYVFSVASEDEIPSFLTYLSQKIIKFGGRQSRFFFYKVAYGTGDSANFSLGSAGPFPINNINFPDENTFGGIYNEKNFDSEDLSAQMDALIKQMEDGFKWETKN